MSALIVCAELRQNYFKNGNLAVCGFVEFFWGHTVDFDRVV